MQQPKANQTSGDAASRDNDRDPLEELATEFIEQSRRGEVPSIERYAAEHPELADAIRELFPTIAAMENLKVCQEDLPTPRAAGAPPTIERLGDLRIVGEIGRGGMGIVYEAIQESLQRRVAVKVLPKQFLLDERRLRRFQREARTAANLHHTNIVPILGVGQHDGYHYYVMQYIRGVGLDEVAERLREFRVTGILQAGGAGCSGRTVAAASVARMLVRGGFQQRPPTSSASGWTRADRKMQAGQPPESAVSQHSKSAPMQTAGSGQPAGLEATALHSADEHSPITQCATATQPIAEQETWDDESPEFAETQPMPVVQPGSLPFGADYWRGVARIGMQVADALAYAHEQGVLHRDIKPANLLLDGQGVVWVADFGLAKAVEQDDVSRSGDIVGTLRYMAPEQFRSEADARSDIYSLGLTLYELLTLQPAYEDSARRQSLLRGTKTIAVKPPRQIDPTIPKDLETIVLKAIADEPSRRYQTSAELAEDLERFLDDRPILARRITASERLWRWCRRNRAMAALIGTALTLLVLVATLATAGYLHTKQANSKIRAALTGEREQRERAEATLEISLEALDRVASRLMPDRLSGATPVAVEVDEGQEVDIPVQPVLSKEDAALLEDLLPLYDRLAEQYAEDTRLRHEVAQANRRVGEIQSRLGNLTQATEAFVKTIEKYQALAADDDSEELTLEMARVYNQLGNVYLADLEFSKAREAHRKALDLLQAADADSVGADAIRYELARTYYYLGRRPDLAGGVGVARGGPPRSGMIPKPGAGTGGRPGEGFGPGAAMSPRPGGPSGLAEGMRQPGWMRGPLREMIPRFHGLGFGATDPEPRDTKPDDWLAQAISLLEPLVEQHPHVPDYQHLLALCYRDRTRDYRSPQMGKAIAMLEAICSDFPGNADYRLDLCETYAKVDTRPRVMSGEEQELIRSRLEKAMNLADELARQHPHEPDYLAAKVRVHHELAILSRQGVISPIESQRAEALRQAEFHYREAWETQKRLVAEFPEVAYHHVWLGIIQHSLATLLISQQKLEEARDLLQQTIDDLEQFEARNPEAVFARGILQRNYATCAEVLRSMGEPDAARRMQDRMRGPGANFEAPGHLPDHSPRGFRGGRRGFGSSVRPRGSELPDRPKE